MQAFQTSPSNLLFAVAATALPSDFSDFLKVFLTVTLLALSAIILRHGLQQVRGTTLMAPIVWTCVSLLALATMLVLNSQTMMDGHLAGDLSLVALVSTFCPLISLLGAKRPQHAIWQWIVFSFWIIAALPALQSLAMDPAEKLEVPIVWQCFYAALLLLGCVNYLPTRYAIVSLLAAAGQVWLFSRFLPVPIALRTTDPLPGIALLCAAVCVAPLAGRFPSLRQRGWKNSLSPLSGWTQVWLDFRNAYGLLWSERVRQRINSLLDSSDAPVWLEWNGFHFALPEADQIPDVASQPPGSRPRAVTTEQVETHLRQTFAAAEPGIRNLLRRFVSNPWIDRRLNSICQPDPSTVQCDAT
ncbi:MAG TPA: hypothetical protein VMJ32_05570 [Pirellulales bacterium]|nr:hypothetical protein [Pirellulales bacterium]